MKKLIKGFFSVAFVLTSSAALANVWTDCEAWYYGGVDKNGSGTFDQQGEWIDIRHRADTGSWSHKANRYNNRNCSFTNEWVFSASANTSNLLQSIFLDPIDGSNNYRSGIRLPIRNATSPTGNIESGNGFGIITNAEFTTLLRFRQSSDYPEAYKDNTSYLLNMGLGKVEADAIIGKLPSFTQNSKHGFRLMLCNSSSDNELKVYADSSTYRTGLYLTNSVIRAKEDVWTELAIVARGGRRLSFCLIQPGCVPVWKDYDMPASVTDAIPCHDSIYLGYLASGAGTYFKGSLNLTAFWNRALTENEILEAFSAGAPDLVQLGCDDGGHEMFTADTMPASLTPSAMQDFSSVPSALTDGMTFNLNYSQKSNTLDMAQVVRVYTHSGEGTMGVKIDGETVGQLELKAGAATVAMVPARCFSAIGSHTLSLAYSGTGAVIDSITLGGSWQLGYLDASNAEFGFFRTSGSSSGPVELAGLREASVAALNNPKNYKKNLWNPGRDPEAEGKIQRFHFNLPAELAERGTFKFTVNMLVSSTRNADWQMRVTVNDTEPFVETVRADFSAACLIHTFTIDKTRLVAGENVIDIRGDHNIGGDMDNGASMDFDRFKMELVKLHRDVGLMLIFR